MEYRREPVRSAILSAMPTPFPLSDRVSRSSLSYGEILEREIETANRSARARATVTVYVYVIEREGGRARGYSVEAATTTAGV